MIDSVERYMAYNALKWELRHNRGNLMKLVEPLTSPRLGGSEYWRKRLRRNGFVLRGSPCGRATYRGVTKGTRQECRVPVVAGNRAERFARRRNA